MNDTYRWRNGRTERCTVHTFDADGNRAYVSWPDSVRQHPRLGLVERPAGWVDADRLGSAYEATAHAIYHEFVDAP